MTDEVARRVVHAAGAVIPALYVVGLVSWEHLQLVLLGGAAVAGGFELLRLVFAVDWWVLDRLFGLLLREYEEDSVAAYAQYVFGGTIVGVVLDPAFAVPALLMLTLADPVSGFVGSGDLRRIKRPEALAAMFGTSLALTLGVRLVGPEATGTYVAVPELTLTAAIAAALGATVADGIKGVGPVVLDDDLTIPIYAGVAGWVGYHVLPDLAAGLP